MLAAFSGPKTISKTPLGSYACSGHATTRLTHHTGSTSSQAATMKLQGTLEAWEGGKSKQRTASPPRRAL
jgi:hypothetical protein